MDSDKKRKTSPPTDATERKAKRQKVNEGSGSKLFSWSPAAVLSSSFCSGDLNRSMAVIDLLDSGSSVPFIARYRKEVTGNMMPDELREFKDRYDALKTVVEKGTKLVASVEKQGTPCPALLLNSLANCTTMDELEILSAPYKPGSKASLAARAVEAGLEDAAKRLLSGHRVDLSRYVDVKKEGRKTLKEVETGVTNIVTDVISHDQKVVDFVFKTEKENPSRIESSKARETKAALAKKQSERVDERKYENYLNFSVPVAYARPHQLLAMNRGERLKVLSVKIVLRDCVEKRYVWFCEKNWRPADEVAKRVIGNSIQEGWKRVVQPMLSRRLRATLNRGAQKEALDCFSRNLREMLLERPNREYAAILAVDPGFRNGCKLAVVDRRGVVGFTGVVRPNLKGGRQIIK